MRLTDFEPLRLDELAPATLASYKTKAGAAATAADAAGDVKTADKRFSGIVKATKKQFDQDAKGVAEDNLHGGRPDDEVKFFIDSEPAYYAVMDRFGDHIEFRGEDMVAPLRLWGAIQQTAGDAGGAADIAGLEDEPMWVGDELDEQGVAEGSEKQLLKQVKQYCRDAWVSNGTLWVECDPLQAKKLSHLLNAKPIPGSVSGEYGFDIKQGVAEGSSYNIDQDDHDEFTPDEIVRIKNSHFPDTLRDNLRAAKKEARRAKHFSSSSDGGDSKLGSPVGSASDNTYEGVSEDALAGMKRLAGIASVQTLTTPGQRQYRHMPTAVQPR